MVVVSMPSQAIKVSSRKGRKMVEIVKILNGEPVILTEEKKLQVPSFVNDPKRNLNRVRRLAEEEDYRAEEAVQPIVNMVNRIAWSVACVVLGWIIALI